MQKIAYSKLVREELLRGAVFAVSFFSIVSLLFVTTAYASDGGKFGELLNKLLVKVWDDPTNDGTARNSANLGGRPASEYQSLSPNMANRSCGANQCIYGFEADGDVMCR